ncbi:MAG: esterase [Mycobacterium sp.]
MRILRFAAALLGACAVVGTIGTPVASAQPGCADLRGVVGQDQICRVHVQTDMYTIDMNFPNDYPDQQSLVSYLTQARDGFANVAEDPDAYNLPYELDADGAGYRSSSLLPGGGTRTVVFSVYQNVGGAHPQTYYQAFNWNLATNAPITFDSLFKPGTRPLDVIYPEVNRYLTREQGLIDAIPQTPGLDPANYQNFALTDDSLIFFFSQGEMFAESAGPVQATVPRAAVAPMLAL